jgi:hypothetical protein
MSIKNCEQSYSDDIRTGYISGLTFKNKEVQYSVVDGLAVFEGDIILGTVEEMERRAEVVRSGMDSIGPLGIVRTGQQYRWPAALMPYEIDPLLTDQHRVMDAIAHWENNTPVRFVLRTPENADQYPNYVRFHPDGSSCQAAVGMQGGKQEISLGPGCGTGSTIHEIGHVWGLWHEQSREDRDTYVKINYENIEPGQEYNFDQHISDGDDFGAYDYGSIMHYGRYAFSKNGQPTIEVLQPGMNIGQRERLSPGDITAVELMYPQFSSKTFVTVISRNSQQLDIFAVDQQLAYCRTAWWDTVRWWGWPVVQAGQFPIGAPIAAVSRNPSMINLFGVGTNKQFYAAWWENGQWNGWLPILNRQFPPGTPIAAIARNPNQMDLFAVADDGYCCTAWWNAQQGWAEWSKVQDRQFQPGTPIAAVSRNPDQMDIFGVSGDGYCYTAWWNARQGWGGWSKVQDRQFQPGTAIAAVSRNPDQMDIFGVGGDGYCYTAWWNARQGWGGWSKVQDRQFQPGTPIAAVSRSPDQMDIFGVGADGHCYTAWWNVQQRWGGWGAI